jgi:hypothetical protein
MTHRLRGSEDEMENARDIWMAIDLLFPSPKPAQRSLRSLAAIPSVASIMIAAKAARAWTERSWGKSHYLQLIELVSIAHICSI